LHKRLGEGQRKGDQEGRLIAGIEKMGIDNDEVSRQGQNQGGNEACYPVGQFIVHK